MKGKGVSVLVDLRPLADQIPTGTILYLHREGDNDILYQHTTLNKEALGHPCCLISPCQDSDLARILVMTTFGSTRMESKVNQSYWQEFLSIFPAPPHPVYPGIQLKMLAVDKPEAGYLDIGTAHWVPWEMLTTWRNDVPIVSVRFDNESMDTILRHLKQFIHDVDEKKPGLTNTVAKTTKYKKGFYLTPQERAAMRAGKMPYTGPIIHLRDPTTGAMDSDDCISDDQGVLQEQWQNAQRQKSQNLVVQNNLRRSAPETIEEAMLHLWSANIVAEIDEINAEEDIKLLRRQNTMLAFVSVALFVLMFISSLLSQCRY